MNCLSLMGFVFLDLKSYVWCELCRLYILVLLLSCITWALSWDKTWYWKYHK